LVLFGIFTSLAIASEYYAVFFLVACLVVLRALLWATYSAFSKRSIDWAIRNWYAPVIAFGLPFVVIAYFYATHITDPSAIAGDQNRIRKLAADAGLQVTSLYADNTQAAITFTVVAP
jgi:membrane protease YdiL (CAAX protease family)